MRLFGTALVVNFDSAAMIEEEAHSGPSSRKSIESGDDYQSGSEQPHSKGCRHICSYAAAPALLFAALARFFCLGFGLVLPEVPRDIFPRFER